LGKYWRKYSMWSEDFPCIFWQGFYIIGSSIRKAKKNIQSGWNRTKSKGGQK
jgi:hypothetical protein